MCSILKFLWLFQLHLKNITQNNVQQITAYQRKISFYPWSLTDTQITVKGRPHAQQ